MRFPTFIEKQISQTILLKFNSLELLNQFLLIKKWVCF